jgi:4-hydroxythreonine-4-phosphate dehydrogenase
MNLTELKRPLAITMGDPAGIGPEIVLKMMADQGTLGQVVYGDRGVLEQTKRALTSISALEKLSINSLADIQAWSATHSPTEIQLVECSQLNQTLAFGQIKAAYGAAAAAAITQASQDAIDQWVSAVVTAPIHKEAFAKAQVPFPGHTEMLAAIAGGPPVRMMLANHELRTVLVTIHASLRKAIELVTFDNVFETITITHAALKAMGIKQPRIAVAGLNPHAGEGGQFGDEEITIIQPAIARAREQNILVKGPFPGDTIFSKARYFKDYDVVIAMYHDQGLIPVKYLGVDEGVNVTLGLPFIRTSVDHGTAFDIAGQGSASAESLKQAVEVALQLTLNPTLSTL